VSSSTSPPTELTKTMGIAGSTHGTRIVKSPVIKLISKSSILVVYSVTSFDMIEI
jgi:hypothetical protein